MKRVLDASALVAYIGMEKGSVTLVKAFADAYEAEETLLISAVNWGEVVCVVHRRAGEVKAREALHSAINKLPLDVVPIDREFADAAATFKIRGKLDFADSFAAALTVFSKGELLTLDRGFESVAREIKIAWL